MNNTQNPINELVLSTDIVDIISRYITVKKAGQNYSALCPFHDDKNPSLMISPSKKIFKCFVCNTAGNVVNFVQNYEKVSYTDAARKIAKLVNFKHEFFEERTSPRQVDKSRELLYKAINDVAAYYRYALLSNQGAQARAYLQSRAITDQHIVKYQIGYAPLNGDETIKFLQSKGHSLKTIEDIGILGGELAHPYDKNQGRLMFALQDRNGQVVGFSARKLDDKSDGPKYINTAETQIFNKSAVLYNYHYIVNNETLAKYVYLVEGFIDVIALDKAGITSAIAMMGTAFSKEHVNMLRMLNKEVRIFLDSDGPGQLATVSVSKSLDIANVQYLIVAKNSEQLDPDDIFNKYGKDKLVSISNKLIDKIEFFFDYQLNNNALETLEERKRFVSEMIDVMTGLKSRLEVDDYLTRLEQKSGFTYAILNQMYEQKKLSKIENQAALKVVSDRLPLKRELNKIQQAERLIVTQMLVDPQAVTFFNKHIRIFTDEVYRYIAAYLNEYGGVEQKINYAELIGDINLRIEDEQKRTYYLQEVIAIEEEIDKVTFNPDLLNDSMRIIMYEQSIAKIEREMKQEYENALTEEEQARILKKYMTQKKLVNAKLRKAKK